MKYLIIFLLFSCTLAKPQKIQNTALAPTKVKIYVPATYELNVGSVKFISFDMPDGLDSSYTLLCDGKEYPYQINKNVGEVYLSESYFGVERSYPCSLKNMNTLDVNEEEVVVFRVRIKQIEFPTEILAVDSKHVELSKKDLERVRKENEILREIYNDFSSRFLFKSSFTLPLDSFITSKYGKRRMFNNIHKSQHLGTDFRASVGTSIPVANAGRVVFVGDLFYSGNTVIVDHGNTIFTMYGHLSKIMTTKNKFVERGEIIGLSGATGRVSGPHLHWGVKVDGNWIDGESLVFTSNEQFK